MEERCAQAKRECEFVVQQVGAVFHRVLVQLGDGEAVTATQVAAIGGHYLGGITTTEYVFRIATGVHQTEFAGLAMLAVVVGIRKPQQLGFGQIPDQRRIEAETTGIGSVWRIEAHAVENVAIAVEIPAGECGVAGYPAIGNGAGAGSFIHHGGATAVGQHVLP